jgi:uncharacterized membrane protein
VKALELLSSKGVRRAGGFRLRFSGDCSIQEGCAQERCFGDPLLLSHRALLVADLWMHAQKQNLLGRARLLQAWLAGTAGSIYSMHSNAVGIRITYAFIGS